MQPARRREDVSEATESHAAAAHYVLTRLALALPTVLILLTLVFLLMRVAPGDPITAALGARLPARSSRSAGRRPATTSRSSSSTPSTSARS